MRRGPAEAVRLEQDAARATSGGDVYGDEAALVAGLRVVHRPDGRPNDWVRWEIRTALESRKPIYPVLLSGATAPRGDDLPPNLREFAKIQMRHAGEASFKADVMAQARELETPFEPVRAASHTPRIIRPPGHSGHGLGRATTIAAVALALPTPWILALAGVPVEIPSTPLAGPSRSFAPKPPPGNAR